MMTQDQRIAVMVAISVPLTIIVATVTIWCTHPFARHNWCPYFCDLFLSDKHNANTRW